MARENDLLPHSAQRKESSYRMAEEGYKIRLGPAILFLLLHHPPSGIWIGEVEYLSNHLLDPIKGPV